jgi:hypothetical protein
MWNHKELLTEELRILEKIAPGDGKNRTGAMRKRMACLFQELGTEHLDGHERRIARQYFAKSLGVEWSGRGALLYAASFLPVQIIDYVRTATASVRGVLRRKEHSMGSSPSWAKAVRTSRARGRRNPAD